MNYEQYVDSKRIEVKPSGFDPSDLNPVLFPFQRDVVRWAVRRGKAALFEDAGLGKSLQEWEFAHQVHQHTMQPVLIVAPLSVSEQMHDEAPTFGYKINLCGSSDELVSGINVTNYEKLGKFSPDGLGGLILDESGILKAGTFGKTATMLTEFARDIPYRLAATATPSPNDLVEIIYHAEFLGIMREAEIKALYFTQDGNSSNQFRLKRNAVDKFYEWLASWAVAIRKPSDLGFADAGFNLPPLNIEQIIVDSSDEFANGTLFTMEAKGISEQRKARKSSINERVQAVADLVNNSNEQWLVWCDLNDESAALTKAIPDAVEVTGSSKDEHKIDAMRGFKSGKYRVVVSKPSMWGFGLNLQNSWNAALCGLGNSFERYYQLIKRQHRFGQTHSVNVKVFVSPADGAVVENIKRKWKQNDELFGQLVKHMAVYTDLGQQTRHEMDYNPQQPIKIPQWMKQPVKTQTEPGMWWIDLDSIPYQWTEAPTFQCGTAVGNQPVVIPNWIQTI